MALTMLPHVNVPPAQTWNYLRVNEIALEVPEACGEGTAPAPELADLETGAGAEAAAWADAAAPERREVRVGAGEEGVVDVLVDDAHPLRATDVVVGAGGRVRINVTEALAAPAPGDAAPVASSCLRVLAGPDARVELVTVVAGTARPTFLDNVGVRLGEGASLDARQYVLCARTSALGLAVDLAGDRSRADLVVRYLVRDGETLDANYVARMRGGDTRCDLSFSGVLEDGARKCLRDTIDLVHGGKGARGREDETVLLAGDRVVNKSLPVILCDEDDVAGDHGATIGSLSPEQLAYLSCRGLTAEEATDLFSRAVADDAHAHGCAEARRAVREAAALVWGDEAARELAEGEPDAEGM